MKRIRQARGRRGIVAATALALLLWGLLVLAGCAGAPRPPADAPDGDGLTPRDRELAVRLHARMQEEHAQDRHRAALRLGYELMDHYRGYERLDDVVLTAARASERLGDPDQALGLTAEFLAGWPDSPARREVLELRARLFEADGAWARAADALVGVHDAATLARDREEAAGRLDAATERLDADALGALRDAHPGSALRPYLTYLWIRALVDEERGREAQTAFADLSDEAPADPWTAHAEQLLRDPTYEVVAAPPGEELPGDVDPLQVGVLCPLTGRYTVLGNAFYDGVRLARDQANREGWRRFALSVRDSEGDPVTAALAVRRFAAEERPIALIGGLLSAPTVAAALTAESFGVPLISPTATNERIWELGPGTFQPNMTGAFEARLLARLAVGVLLKTRVAVLHPDDAAGLHAAQVFADEVLARGGRVVALEAFSTGRTDFREPLKRIAAELPEVVFVPADEDQMMILGPQLDFYRTGALVIGPSSWNSPRLAREVGGILDRSVFPSDAALYPPAWPRAFDEQWDGAELPPEATSIARQAYLAAMMVFRAMGDTGASRPADLIAALGERFENRSAARVDPDAMAASLRMFSGGTIVPFPMGIFAPSLARVDTLGAAADSSGTVSADSLAVPAGPPRPGPDDLR